MASIKALVFLSLFGTIALMFLALACALPQYNNYWPLFVLLFYILAPVPYLFARRISDDSRGPKELAWFITAGIVVSAFGLPIILARAPSHNPVIQWGACGLVLSGNVVTFIAILGFFIFAEREDIEYSMW